MAISIRKQSISFLGKNFSWLLPDVAAESVANEIFVYREYRSAEEIIKSAIHPILDVGAHVGLFSAYASLLNPKIKIYALEPDPTNFELMRQNIRLQNLDNIKLIVGALAEKSEARDLFLSPDSQNHSLLSPSSSKNIKSKISVKAWNLADLFVEYNLERLSLVKLDIEGGEFELFKESSESSWSRVETIIMEVHEEFGSGRELEQRLRSFGFSIQRFPSAFDKSMSFFLARNKKL